MLLTPADSYIIFRKYFGYKKISQIQTTWLHVKPCGRAGRLPSVTRAHIID